jgi:hypothetical protein
MNARFVSSYTIYLDIWNSNFWVWKCGRKLCSLLKIRKIWIESVVGRFWLPHSVCIYISRYSVATTLSIRIFRLFRSEYNLHSHIKSRFFINVPISMHLSGAKSSVVLLIIHPNIPENFSFLSTDAAPKFNCWYPGREQWKCGVSRGQAFWSAASSLSLQW